MAGPGNALLFLALMWLVPQAADGAFAGSDSVKLTIVPDHIRVGALFHGTRVHISADIPLCDAAIIKIEGKEEQVVLNRKDRVAVIWLNVDQVTVKNAPQVYILTASDKLTNICSQEEREKLGLGFEALSGRITFESNKPSTSRLFEEFVKLKRHSGAYYIDTEINLDRASVNRQALSASLPIPSTMPAGEYTVWLYCFEQRKLMNSFSSRLLVEKVGLPLLMIALANEHAPVYGIIAIIVAMAAGLTMGLIFSSRRARG